LQATKRTSYARYHDGWKRAPNKDDIHLQLDHLGFCEKLARVLAARWSEKAKMGEENLHAQLLKLPHAFPRGRIVVHENRQFVRHGNDIQNNKGVSLATIETLYGLHSPARILDSHETTSGTCGKDTREGTSQPDDVEWLWE